LAFRDYLIANPIIANKYGELKIESAKRCNNDIAEYIKLKSEFIKFYEEKAIKWWDDNKSFQATSLSRRT
jgi:GrpB-like predicted nucleotidyltransferase (UPF0157 family)